MLSIIPRAAPSRLERFGPGRIINLRRTTSSSKLSVYIENECRNHYAWSCQSQVVESSFKLAPLIAWQPQWKWCRFSDENLWDAQNTIATVAWWRALQHLHDWHDDIQSPGLARGIILIWYDFTEPGPSCFDVSHERAVKLWREAWSQYLHVESLHGLPSLSRIQSSTQNSRLERPGASDRIHIEPQAAMNLPSILIVTSSSSHIFLAIVGPSNVVMSCSPFPGALELLNSQSA